MYISVSSHTDIHTWMNGHEDSVCSRPDVSLRAYIQDRHSWHQRVVNPNHVAGGNEGRETEDTTSG